MSRNFQYFLLLGLMASLFAGCKCDEPGCKYDVPTSYSFYNVDLSGQDYRLAMLDEMISYIESAQSDGVTLDAQVIRNMYANQNSPFTNPNLNTAGKDMQSKTFSLDTAAIIAYFDLVAQASQSTQAASNGVAGRLSSLDGSTYLFDENGVDLMEVIEKSLMGAFLYYQISEVYLSEDKIGLAVDNQNVLPGVGTDMEHHWDEAFGYFGVPYDFPDNTSGLQFIGKYCNGRDAVLNLNETIMNAYILGRAAISNEDHETKDAMAVIVREGIEKVFVGTAIHYINGAKDNLADDAARNHELSEAVSLIKSLKYNSTAKISAAEIDQVVAKIGTNFYTVTQTGLDQARDQLSSIYGLDGLKDQL